MNSKRLMAGLTAIFVGGFGIHKFVLGYNKEGIFYLVFNLIVVPVIGSVTCGAGFTSYGISYLLPIIEGIIYLSKTDTDFINTYQINKKLWF